MKINEMQLMAEIINTCEKLIGDPTVVYHRETLKYLELKMEALRDAPTLRGVYTHAQGVQLAIAEQPVKYW